MPEFVTDVFSKFQDQWALLTAGSIDNFNTMTIRWGGLGTLWGKPVATVYVKPIRYTYEFMERYDHFTISFFGDNHRKALGILGTLSGRDCDKVSRSGLTPKALDHGVTFDEAVETIVCKTIYRQDLSTDAMPKDVIRVFYETEAPHRMYIGEVIEILK